MPKRTGEPPLFRRGDSIYWWTWYYQGKRRVRVSTQCTDRKAALVRAVELQRAGAAPAQPGEGATVSAALLAFVAEVGERAESTIGAYDRRAEQVAKVIGGVLLVDLSAEHVRQYLAARSASKATKRAELTVLWMALKLARRRGWQAPHKEMIEVAIPGQTPKKERWLTDAEIDALCAKLPWHRAEWVRVACWTGARREEVNALLREDVDPVAGTILIRGTKTAKSRRVVPIPAPMLEWLKVRGPVPGPLVHRWPQPCQVITPACRKAGIPHCSPHDFRRTYASRLKQRGVDSLVVARLLGHTTGRLVDETYAHYDVGTLAQAVKHAWESPSLPN
jgi:integrase